MDMEWGAPASQPPALPITRSSKQLVSCRNGGPPPGSPAAVALGSALRVGAELLEVQGQSVAGWHGQCTLRLLRERAKERPLRLKFSSGRMVTGLSTTELLGAAAAAGEGVAAAAAAAAAGGVHPGEAAEIQRRCLMGRLSLLRVDRLLREVIATPACIASLGAEMAELLSAELEEECLQLGAEEVLLEEMQQMV